MSLLSLIYIDEFPSYQLVSNSDTKRPSSQALKSPRTLLQGKHGETIQLHISVLAEGLNNSMLVSEGSNISEVPSLDGCKI